MDEKANCKQNPEQDGRASRQQLLFIYCIVHEFYQPRLHLDLFYLHSVPFLGERGHFVHLCNDIH